MKTGFRMGARLIGFELAATLMALVLLLPTADIGWLQILLNLGFLAGYGVLLWSDACSAGEAAATISATIARQREEGRGVDPAQQAKAHNPRAAWIGYGVGVLPFFALALVNLALRTDITQFLCRISFAPYVGVFMPLDDKRAILNALFVLFSLALPVVMPIGYMRGPKLRQMKLEAIAKGSRRKKRNLRVNAKPKTPKPPKMEV